jgi:hypothetical protein
MFILVRVLFPKIFYGFLFNSVPNIFTEFSLFHVCSIQYLINIRTKFNFVNFLRKIQKHGRYSDWLQAGFQIPVGSRPAMVTTQPPIQWVPGVISLGVKRPGREAHSPPGNAEIKEMCIYISTPP